MKVKAGDRVFFYFRHDFSTAVNPMADGCENAFTGESEMRCRPAEVLAVLSESAPELVAPFQTAIVAPGDIVLFLRVSFAPDDRSLAPGGVVFPPSPMQPRVCAHNGTGELRTAWPEHGTWAFDSKTAN